MMKVQRGFVFNIDWNRYTAASSVFPLISMGALNYAYECKYSEHNM